MEFQIISTSDWILRIRNIICWFNTLVTKNNGVRNMNENIEEIINDEKFNNLMRDVQILKKDVVALGENKEYITQLDYGYVETYLIKGNEEILTKEYIHYRRLILDHLLDIVKMKYYINYEILNKEFGK